jgi:rare lipoprotein A
MARRTRGNAAATLTACLLSIAANSNAASANPIEFATPRYLTVGSVQSVETPSTFASRFEYAQASLSRSVIERLIIFVPMMPLETAALPRRQTIVTAGPPMVGAASMYNPNDSADPDSGNSETASGERYDAEDWTAAIRTDLRQQFGGVRFGKNYRPAFALVRSQDRQAIVRINDVGPLKPGRVIDLNVQAMRYFDPTLQLGLIGDVEVTPLAGETWALGPVVDDPPVAVAVRFDQ